MFRNYSVSDEEERNYCLQGLKIMVIERWYRSNKTSHRMKFQPL